MKKYAFLLSLKSLAVNVAADGNAVNGCDDMNQIQEVAI